MTEIKTLHLSVAIFFLLAALGCDQSKQQVDLLVYNANIYTVDATFSTANAFAVDEGKFVAVGDSEDLLGQFTADKVWDAQGETIIPGIVDGHGNLFDLGLTQGRVNLQGSNSFDEVLARVSYFHKGAGVDFIHGFGWDQNLWEDNRLPHKGRLDRLYPDVPVVLTRIDGQAVLANQKAIDMAGVQLGDYSSGDEVIWKDRRPTGILMGAPAEKVRALIPEPDTKAKIQALQVAERICLAYGITTVNDSGMEVEDIVLVDSLQKAGVLSIRVHAMVNYHQQALDYMISHGPINTPQLRADTFRVYGDGALGSRGAALKEPYSDMLDYKGSLANLDSLTWVAQALEGTKFRLSVSAVGDAAVSHTLQVYKDALAGKTDQRWRIEHLQLIDPLELEHLQSDNIIPSVQPMHAISDMAWVQERLGPKRLSGAYAYKSLLKQSGKIALGSDFPIEQMCPFITFHAAVARKDVLGYPETGFLSEESLSREEALRGMTIWAAFANKEDDVKGSIEPGKFADFVVISDDIMTLPIKKVPALMVVDTYLGGKKITQQLHASSQP